LSFFIKL